MIRRFHLVLLLVCCLGLPGCGGTPTDVASDSQPSEADPVDSADPVETEAADDKPDGSAESVEPMESTEATEATSDKSPKDEDLLGTWINPENQNTMVFTKDQIRIDEYGDILAGSYSVDTSQSPRRFDAQVSIGMQTIPMVGLYEVKGDQLRMGLVPPKRGTDEAGQPIPVPGDAPESLDSPDIFVSEFVRMKRVVADQPLVTIGRRMPWVSDGSVAFAPDGKTAAVTLGSRVLFWNLETNEKAGWLLDPFDGGIGHLDFSPNGKLLVVASGNLSKGIAVWDVESKERVLSLEDASRTAEFTADSKRLAVGGHAKPVRLIDLESGEATLTFQAEPDEKGAYHLDISPDETLLATTNPAFNVVSLWDMKSGERVGKLTSPDEHTKRCVVFHPDGKMLAVSSEYGPVELWDVENRKLISKMEAANDVSKLAFSPDGKVLATIGHGVQLWDVTVSPTKFLAALPSIPNEDTSADSVSFSPDGKLLGVGGGHTCRIWPMIVDGVSATDLEPTYFPPKLTEAGQQELDLLSSVASFRMAFPNLEHGGRRLKDVTDDDGKPILSWRLMTLSWLGNGEIMQEIDRTQPYDAPVNAAKLEKGNAIFEFPGSKPGTTPLLMATGPGTAYEKPGEVLRGKDLASETIRLVVVDPEQGLPWAAPGDFVFNPDDPWAGLPKEGFIAVFWNGGLGFVKGDTPPETLKAMFTIDGGEEFDIEAVTSNPYSKFLYGETE